MYCGWGTASEGAGVVTSEYAERLNLGARGEDGVDDMTVSA